MIDSLKRVILMWQSIGCYIIADPKDDSVTLSERLYNHMKGLSKSTDEAKVFVFKVPDTQTYGFMLNPNIEDDTQWCQIQYNEKYRCVGFQTLCPTVGRILYDYGLGAHHQVKLSVTAKLTATGKIYYNIEKPHEKHIR